MERGMMSTEQNTEQRPDAPADKSAQQQWTPEPRIYRIIRFRFNGRPRTIRNNVTLTEAQNHCSRADTSSHSTGNGAWFDGYDYMKGRAPKQR
jgi:hypothetical protein